LEILLQAQRGMTLHDWTIFCFVLVKILILNGAKLGFKMYGKITIFWLIFLSKKETLNFNYFLHFLKGVITKN